MGGEISETSLDQDFDGGKGRRGKGRESESSGTLESKVAIVSYLNYDMECGSTPKSLTRSPQTIQSKRMAQKGAELGGKV